MKINTTYLLVDVEGFCNKDMENSQVYLEHIAPHDNSIEFDNVEGKYGQYNNANIVSIKELEEYFIEGTTWNGKLPIVIGHTTTIGAEGYTVINVVDDSVVLRSVVGGIKVYTIEALRKFIPKKSDELYGEVLEQWRMKGLENANDNKYSLVQVDSFYCHVMNVFRNNTNLLNEVLTTND